MSRGALAKPLVPPPRGLDPVVAKLIEALAREAADRDHEAASHSTPAATNNESCRALDR